MAEDDLNRAVVNAAGELRLDQELVQRISVTDSGPVLTGALLEGLPGPCDPVREPDIVDPIDVNCSNSPSARSFELYNNTTAEYQSPDGSGRRYTVWSKTVRVVRDAPFRVFFDFDHPELNGAGVSIIQSGAAPFALSDDGISLDDDSSSGGGSDSGNGPVQTYGVNGTVYALTNTQDGKYVYAGGDFTRAGYVSASRIARWNTLKSTWESVGADLPDTVQSLDAIEDNGTWKVYAGGSFGVRVYTESTGTWESLTTVDSGSVLTMDHSRDGTKLFLGGDFVKGSSTGILQYNLDTDTVTDIGSVSGGDARVNDLHVFFNNMMAVGSFTSIGGVSTSEGIATFILSALTWTDRSGVPGFTTGWEATCTTWSNDAFVVGGISTETSEQSSKYKTASSGTAGDKFRGEVAVDSDRIIVNGVDKDNKGLIFIYDSDGNLVKRMTVSKEFGQSIAAGSGRIVARTDTRESVQVSAYSVSIYDLNGALIKEVFSDKGLDPYNSFGWSVAVGDNRIVVGDHSDDSNGNNSGAAYLYDLDGTLIKKITAYDIAAEDRFGRSVAVGSGRIVVSAPYDNRIMYPDESFLLKGAVYIYDLDGNLVKKVTPNSLGVSVIDESLAVGEGRIVLRGGNRTVCILDLDGNLIKKFTTSVGLTGGDYDDFGGSLAIGSGRIVVGAVLDEDIDAFSGAAYIFDLNGDSETKIIGSDVKKWDQFGRSIAITENRILVTADDNPVYDGDDNSTGAVYIFDLDGNELRSIAGGDPGLTDAETGFLAVLRTDSYTWTTFYNWDTTSAYAEAAIADARINALEATNAGVWIGGDFSNLSGSGSLTNNLIAKTDTNLDVVSIVPRIDDITTIGLAGPSVKALTYTENSNIPLVFGGEINNVAPTTPASNVFYRASTANASTDAIDRFESALPEPETPPADDPADPADQQDLGQVFAAWFEDPATRRLRDTRSDGNTLTTSGGQIGRFGVDPISAELGTLSRPVLQLFDIDEQTLLETDFFVGLDDPAQLSGQNLIPVYSNQDELRTRGYGYIQTTVNCAQGEFVTVFVIADTSLQKPQDGDAPRIWQVVLDYQKAALGGGGSPPCDPENENAPSRAYQQGAVVNEWVGGSQYGYFGQTQSQGETVGAVGSGLERTADQPNERFVDNIYYPYEAPPVNYIEEIINGLNANNPGADLAQGYYREGSRWAGAVGVLANVQQTPRYIRELNGIFSMPSGSRTVEIKGYFRAPVTGNYEFFGSASDGMWMWISSDGVGDKQRAGVDDLGNRWNGTTEQPMEGGEFFVQDGFAGGTGRNYGRNNYVLRVGPRTAGITGLQSNGIRVYLKEGSYYFVRILSGVAFQQGFFQIEYQLGSGGGNVVRNNLVFSGRTCATDSPSVYQDPTGSGVGGSGGGSVIAGPGPGGGFGGGGGGGPVIDLFGSGTPLPWWWGQPINPNTGSPNEF